MLRLPPIPQHRQCGMPHPAPTKVWAHMGLCLDRAQGRAHAPALRCQRQTSKKPPPGNNNIPYMLKCVAYNSQYFVLQICYKYCIPSRIDYHHKNRIKILYKKTCFAAPHVFSRADFLGNYLNCRTLTRMSTRKCTVAALIACQIKTVICWSVIAIHKSYALVARWIQTLLIV